MAKTQPNAIRVGIDVGGTFTDAVAIDAGTLELVGQAKVLTTHSHAEGVARGIIDALHELLRRTGRDAGDVVFLAHGTTQATNALLEGDVAKVGLVGLGRGLDGWRTRSLARLGRLQLAPGKHLPVVYEHARSGGTVDAAVKEVRSAGAEVVVGVEAFSVDDPTGEQAVVDAATREGVPATATHVISKLYGLSKRARTAAVNASILPRMLATAELVQTSIEKAGITAPLMVMRCDGGVMSLAEMRERPLLTILSGPAAGAAGALLGERVGEGVFLETGGTSTDISVIREGRVAVSYAKVGGYDTYLKALDVRTVGIGGGSLARLDGRRIVDVGPRSAHIAGLAYACYADQSQVSGARLALVAPMPGDPADYVVVESDNGRYAITVTCAANALGLIPAGDHAYADAGPARAAFEPLAQAMGTDVDGAARAVLDRAGRPVQKVVEELAKDYQLDSDDLLLVGGGGGAAAVTPHVARTLKAQARLAENAAVISPIGVALALVRDTVERVVPEPSQADLLSVRAEAEGAILRQGASPDSIEVDVTVDPQRNVVSAVATGATEFRTRQHMPGSTDGEAALEAVARRLRVTPGTLTEAGSTDSLRVLTAPRQRSGPLRFVTSPRYPAAVIDGDGIVRFHTPDARVRQTTVEQARGALGRMLDELTSYGDGGARIPAVQLLLGGRLVNLAGVTQAAQALALADSELSGRPDQEKAVLLAEERA